MADCRRPDLSDSLGIESSAGLCVVMVTPSVSPPVTALFPP